MTNELSLSQHTHTHTHTHTHVCTVQSISKMSACCRAFKVFAKTVICHMEVVSHLSVASLCCECEGHSVAASDVNGVDGLL